MNHIYRLVWNVLANTWVAVAENVRAHGKRASAVVSAAVLCSTTAGGAAWALDPNTLPAGGQVVAGTATISQAANSLNIHQATQRTAIDWQSFNIGSAATVNFQQPNSSAVALNRILGNSASEIYGKLNANGQVFFSNPNGMLFARGAQVNVGGILATTMNISNSDFMAGNYKFNNPGSGIIRNEGILNATGSVALVGDTVQNAGQIIATTATLVAGNQVAIDLTGDGLIRARIDEPSLKAQIDNSGSINAVTAVTMSAGQARSTLDRVVNNSGVVKATGLVERGGEIILEAATVKTSGTINASNQAGSGGTIDLHGNVVAAGGPIEADGTSGGRVSVNATGMLSLAEPVSAKGTVGAGGSIFYSAGKLIETSTGSSDATGATDGGTIRAQAGGTLMTSGTYTATGGSGQGGHIDLTATDLRLLSTQIDASGNTQGGLVRLGGAYQGGRTDEAHPARRSSFLERWSSLPTMTNAGETLVNDGTKINVAAKVGAGGTAIIWSDKRTTFLGGINASGLTTGGGVEISSKEQLRYVDLQNVTIGQGGHLLLDPKDIVIGTAQDSGSWAYAGILRPMLGAAPETGKSVDTSQYSSTSKNLDTSQYSTSTASLDVATLAQYDNFGSAVALNATGDRLAVGAYGDAGAGNDASTSGAVYLFSFTDTSFSGGTLQATLGKGYTGGKNINVSSLETYDNFGSAVAFNATGDRLAVGARSDFGASNLASYSGAVHLFSFSDTSFTGGALQATLGKGYTGSKNVDVTILESADSFGSSVALNATGDRLAVGAISDSGFGNSVSNSGAVHLFSFTDTSFSGGSLQGTIGKGYSNGKNVDLAGLETNDNFGFAVALNAAGDRLAVGSWADAGFGNVATQSGAVNLFSFTDTSFTGGTLQATLGKGYSGGKNVDVAGLDAFDNFGAGIALNAAGDRLAVGATGDAGITNAAAYAGAVHLFSFSDTNFTTGTLLGSIGKGYTTGKNVDVAALEANDRFGGAIALNAAGDRLAVGVLSDSGASNAVLGAGAVHLVSFSDTSFSGGTLLGTIGQGYVPVTTPVFAAGDYFGSAVALNAAGDRLAVGASGDDSASNFVSNSGAVHLFSFTDSSFSGGTLQATLGKGYSGGKNVDVTGLEAGDVFGTAVALNATGDRLAVGANNDGGSGNVASYSGAVHLFSFSDTSFSGGTLQATLGKGYSGGKNVDVAGVESFDYFGSAVALNATGDRLAVGANNDAGTGNFASGSGAVHLFSFSDTSFSGGMLQATLGKGYSGGKNVDVADLAVNDNFGAAVALNATGDRLAVGVFNDAGAGNVASSSGAVRLFSFSDSSFSGGTLQATLGKGYSGGKNIDVAGLEAYDSFGSAVALNASGDRLAVGAIGDAGAGNVATNAGAVHLFSFSDSSFSGGTLQATLGKGYSGGKNIDVAGLAASNYFGSGVALNASGDRLAVGAYSDDGAANVATDSGAVHLFSFTDTSFSGGKLLGTIGMGYVPVTTPTFEALDWLGSGIALNATGERMAVGASHDAGAGNSASQSGAVHLFSFTDTSFSGGTLQATLGKGYSGGKNIDVAGLEGADYFGAAVALNAAGDRLAVGAPGDDSSNNSLNASGAVRLFSFSDTTFSGGTLQATLGNGYTGGKNLDLAAVEAGDQFGSAVAFNAAGDRLAVGAAFDAGESNLSSISGAVHLFSFIDTSFTGGALQATLGKGYSSGKNVDVAGLEGFDNFGSAVALNAAGDRLAVGAYSDGGAGNNASQSGAAYLFSFTDTSFSGGVLQATLGKGYTVGKNVDVAGLEAYDWFGSAVALNATGDRLAVGAYWDDGAGNVAFDAGAVYLFSFTDTNFSGGALQATLGEGYSGGKNVDVAGLAAGDQFGISVALNATGDRLAVGAYGDDGASTNPTEIGAVHLLSFSDTNFSGGKLLGTVGSGYSSPSYIVFDRAQQLGSAVALNAAGDRLAVGAVGDGGAGDVAYASGAVHLFSFSDTSFSGGTLQASLGKGYTGGKNVDVAALAENDFFGSAVALNATGDRLAVGAYGDAGAGDTDSTSGAVYLFSFTDNSFSGGTLQATLGKGYTGGKNINVSSLETLDNFGFSVAFNAAGDRLAVGARQDFGAGNAVSYTGAVHLFSFSDTSFTGGTLQATLGTGYTGGKNVDVAGLESSDSFGSAVALNATGDRLAVGSNGDDGVGNVANKVGAVHLFSFSDTSFSGGTLQATLGKGYTGGKNVDVAGLESSDSFGSAVALNAAGDRLTVGTPGDDGASNVASGSGNVQMFSFSDTSFSGGTLQSTLGKGYTGGKNVDLTGLDAFDNFGSAVALNATGNRLAVGAAGDAGAGNNVDGSGAIQLFSFSDTNFSGGKHIASIGAVTSRLGYGNAIALNAAGDRLAVGAPGDDGANNDASNSGAVHLFSFSDTSFTGGTLEATLGKGYTGGKNVDVAGLETSDSFGYAIALNAAGDRLAVGAPADGGVSNVRLGSGAVRLFSFTDTNFTGGVQQAILGKGYSGGKNVDVAGLEAYDQFGSAVALNVVGNRLAVGANGDSGFGNTATNSGAAYLFSFADNDFSSGMLEGTIGMGYSGAKNIDLSLAGGSPTGFGFQGIALNAAGDRLAVGSWDDNGFGGTYAGEGAVYLFTFADGNFSGGAHAGTFGMGFTGPKDFNLSSLIGSKGVNSGDFGIGLALNAAGDRLAVGDHYASFDNYVTSSGVVHLFSFTDTNFSGVQHTGMIGQQVSPAAGSLVTTNVPQNSNFGWSVAMNATGNLLAVGAPFENSLVPGLGGVYLFSLSGAASSPNFSDMSGQTSYVAASQLATTLSSGTSVTLQASNDITLNNALSVNNASGNGGNLSLQAGRSIMLNANITTDNGNFSAIANETLANGVVNADRDAGAANITMADGTAIQTGSGNVSMLVKDGAGLTNNQTGLITLRDITTTGGNIDINSTSYRSAVRAWGNLVSNGGDIALYGMGNASQATGVAVNFGSIQSGSGAITIDGIGSLQHGVEIGANASLSATGAGAISVTGQGGGSGGTPGAGIQIATGDPVQITASGSGGIVLSGIGGNADNPGSNYGIFAGRATISTFGGDLNVTGVGGGVAGGSNNGGNGNAGLWFAGTTLRSTGAGNIVVTGTAGTGVANPAVKLAISGATPALLDAQSSGQISVVSQGLFDNLIGSGVFAVPSSRWLVYAPTPVAAANKNGLTSAFRQYNTNYGGTINGSGNGFIYASAPGTLTVDTTLTAGTASHIYGETPTAVFDVSLTGFADNEDNASTIGLTGGTFSFTPDDTTAANAYQRSYVSGMTSSSGYSFTAGTGLNYTVTQRSISLTADDQSKTYGATDPMLSYQIGGLGLVNGDNLTGSLTAPTGQSATAGTHSITQGTLMASSNYSVSGFTPGTLTVAKATLTTTADDKTRVYGENNPSLTGSALTGFVYAEDATVLTTAPSFSTTASPTSNVGSYPIVGAGGTAANYDFSYVPGSLSVGQRALTLAADNQSKTYGATDPALSYQIGGLGLVNGDGLTGSMSAPTGQAATAGTHSITQGTLMASSNYNTSFTPGTLTVAKAMLTATADNKTRTYGDINPALTGAMTGFDYAEDATALTTVPSYSTTASPTSNVGSYAIVGAGGTAANYDFSYVTGSLSVGQRAISLTADNQSKTYGATDPTLSYQIGGLGLVNGDSLTGSLSAPTGQSATAGTHSITQGTLMASSNYNVTGFTPGTLTVAKAMLTATGDNKTRTYGDSNPSLTGALAGFAYAEDTTALTTVPSYSTTASPTSNVGSYPIVGAGGTAVNYSFSYVDGSLGVTQRAISLTADNQSKTYGATDPTLSYQIGGLGLVTGDNLTGSLSAPTGQTATAGTHSIAQGTLTASSNYSTSFTAGTLTVAKATLTATADNKTRIYGDANPGLTGALTGFVYAEAATALTAVPSFSTTASPTSNVGSYPIVGAGGMAANYDFSYVTGSLSVGQRAISLTADNQSKTYGATDPALSYQIGGLGLVNGDNLTGTLSVPTGQAATAGTHSITQGTLAVSSNYSTSFMPGTLTVAKATLTATADNKTRTYGDADPSLTGALTGFVYAEDPTALIAAPSYSTTASLTSNVGSYAIVGAGGTAANYDFSYVPGSLSIDPRLVSLSFDPVSKVYDGTTDIVGGFPMVLNNVLSQDLAGLGVSGSGSYVTPNAGSGKAVSYTGLALSGNPATNYLLSTSINSYTPQTSSTGLGNIDRRPITIASVTPVSKVYDGNTDVTTGLTMTLSDNVLAQDSAQLGITFSGIYDTRHVASNKAVTYSNLALSGTAKDNYVLNTSLTSNQSMSSIAGVGSVTQLASVGWMGGSAGDWFTAANWFGGALPDNNNVSAVVFPQAVSVTTTIPFDLGDTNITANGGGFSLETRGGLTTGGGRIQVSAGTLSLITHSPMVIGRGGLTAASGITLTSATAEAGSTITLNGPISTSSGSATLAAYGNVTQNANITAPSVSVSSTSGSITVASNATTSASNIAYAAPAGSIAASASSFSGATPVLTVAAPTTTTTGTPVSDAQQQTSTVVNQMIQNTVQLETDTGPTTFTMTTDGEAGSKDTGNSSTGTTKEEDEKKTQNQTAGVGTSQESSKDQPADSTQQGGNVVQLVVANTTIQKPVEQIVEVNVPKTRTLVCR